MKYLIPIIALALSACATVPQDPASIPQDSAPAPALELPRPAGLDCKAVLKGIEATCPKPGTWKALDMSVRVDRRAAEVFACLGVETVFRYGDYTGQKITDQYGTFQMWPTISTKVPTAAESKILADLGIEEMHVFQHNNSSPATFTALRGRRDAEQMQRLYPNDRTWYFGVDYDADNLAGVYAYFTEVNKVAKKHGKLVGAYGNGHALTNLKAKGLITFMWRSMSTGHRGSKELTASGKWALLQQLDRKCGGKDVDFNQTNPALPDYGQRRK